MGDVDRLVSAEPQRETTAAELLPLVYEELRRLAAAKMAREPSGDTFQATALVHEAWLRLNGTARRALKIARTSSAPPLKPCAES